MVAAEALCKCNNKNNYNNFYVRVWLAANCQSSEDGNISCSACGIYMHTYINMYIFIWIYLAIGIVAYARRCGGSGGGCGCYGLVTYRWPCGGGAGDDRHDRMDSAEIVRGSVATARLL